MHDKLLYNSNRVKRNLAYDPCCNLCDAREETIIHLLRDCPTDRHVWMKVFGGALKDDIFDGSLQCWIACNLRAKGMHQEDTWPSYFAITCWSIWRMEMEELLDVWKGNDIPLDIHGFLKI